jgi:hypothetical protein
MNLKNEIARRYTLRDWYISSKINRLIGSVNADQIIAEIIKCEKPALVGRLGGTEGRFIGEFIKMQRYEKLGISMKVSSTLNYRWQKRSTEIAFNAGFGSNSWEEIEKFVTLYEECLTSTDVLGAWGTAFAWAESIAFSRSNHPTVIPIGHTAPWVEPVNSLEIRLPWSNQLDGKKILVVAGFADSIQKQHGKRTVIFPGVTYPEFDLKTIKAPLSAGRNSTSKSNWFKNLESMKEQMSEKNFDIALISAGAYSYPLALEAKRLGRIGIHCGGALQLFFGIMGGRWEQDANILSRQNKNWIRPSDLETPEYAKAIENGCYW